MRETRTTISSSRNNFLIIIITLRWMEIFSKCYLQSNSTLNMYIIYQQQPEFELDEHLWMIERSKCKLEFAIWSKIVTNVIFEKITSYAKRMTPMWCVVVCVEYCILRHSVCYVLNIQINLSRPGIECTYLNCDKAAVELCVCTIFCPFFHCLYVYCIGLNVRLPWCQLFISVASHTCV